MAKRIINFVLLLIATGILWYIDYNFKTFNTQKFLQTSISISLIYFLFTVFLNWIVIGKIKNGKARYSVRKAVSMIQLIILLVVFITIWIENVQALFVAYGLIAAGVAISLQDFFKNIMGGIIVLTGRAYGVGDRIEVKGKTGDIVDIGLMYTTLLELREWVNGDQTTGRLITIPNGLILSEVIHNYTKDNSIMWDEITVPLTYKSNWRSASEDIEKILTKETMEVKKTAEKEIASLSGKYFLLKRDASPSVYYKMTDNWVEVYFRYVTFVRERRKTYTKLTGLILDYIEKNNEVSLASETVDIIGFPGKN